MFAAGRQSWYDSNTSSTNQYWISTVSTWLNTPYVFLNFALPALDGAGNIYFGGYDQNTEGDLMKLTSNSVAVYGEYNNLTAGVGYDGGILTSVGVNPGGSILYAIGYNNKGEGSGQNDNTSILYKFNGITGAISATYNLSPLQWSGNGPSGQTPQLSVGPNGNVLVVGVNHPLSGAITGVIYYFDSNLSLQWSRQLSISGQSLLCYGGVIDNNANIYVYGTTSLGGGATCFLAKYNSSGVLQWQRFINSLADVSSEHGENITVDNAGNVYLVVANTTAGVGIVCYDSNGNQVSVYGLDNASGGISYNSINFDGTGNLYLTGTTLLAPYPSAYIPVISKVTTSGTSVWHRGFGFNANVTNNYANAYNLHVIGQTYYSTLYSQRYTTDYTQETYIVSLPTDGSLANTTYSVGNIDISYFTFSNVTIGANTSPNTAGNLSNTSVTTTFTTNNAITWTSFSPVVTQTYIGSA